MSSTLLIERKETRRLMRDTNLSNPAVSTRELNRILEGEMHATADAVGLGTAWETGVVTLDGRDPPDYALPSTAARQYLHIVGLRRAADNGMLQNESVQTIMALRYATLTPAGNYPTHYALLEDTSQVVSVLLYPRPTLTGTLDLLRSVIPTSFNDDDAAVIPFDRDLLEGFRQGCAVRGIAMMNPEQQASRGFAGMVVRGRYAPSAHVQNLAQGYASAKEEARVRLFRIKRASRPGTVWPVLPW